MIYPLSTRLMPLGIFLAVVAGAVSLIAEDGIKRPQNAPPEELTSRDGPIDESFLAARVVDMRRPPQGLVRWVAPLGNSVGQIQVHAEDAAQQG